MYRLDGKRVVITGAGSGLGRALSLALASRGCRIGVVDIDESRAGETLEMVRQKGGDGEAYRLDVSRPEEVEAMAEHFFRSWGGVDVLVNNAGVVSTGFVGDIPLEDWEWVFGVNFWGMLYGCHFFIPRMKTQGGGYIVNVASAAGLLTLLEMGPYNATKAAVIALTETLRSELAPFNIGVTAVCPMFFNTRLLESMRYTDDFEREFAETTFRYARMSAEQVAEAVIQAVEKRRLYVVPQLSGRLFWLIKRMKPGLYHRTLAFFNRDDLGRRLLLWMARKGLIQ
ncbi:SDR family NAD(P)-dependent oxidoreductase [Candidatus Solincola sp.]|jgi:NAD(P)-dependent dehydrogenase (short-subunit alcohol dehydrogenase family)|nr:SDR family NAD(P)-dependent oxidoreductase [Actinomycetota bacterium]